jgi:hypothetical protein
VIDSNGSLTEQHMNALNELIFAYPNDKIIVITPEANIQPGSFKKLTYQRPDDSVI